MDVYLAGKAAKGDVDAFETLIMKYEKTIYNIALRMMTSPEDAKDVSQNVLIKIYNNISRFKGDSLFSTWIYRITVNTCIDEMRKNKRKTEISMDDEDTGLSRIIQDTAASPEQSIVEKEGYNSIINAINELPEEYKTVITLRDIEGFSYQDIAEITECSLGTVKSRISRARAKLKELLLEKGELIESGGRLTFKKGGKG
ncbi:MAG: sigma-70 family RNA polymerase sigma factor [Lachnospiraceae bacterium]|nr:sigma-70 family RNA polymerase sigma factor [Lachnospiraceae bacterium]